MMNARKSVSRNEGLKALVFCFLLLSLSECFSGCFSRERAVLNAVAIEVNGHELSTKEFAERLALRLKSFDALYAKDDQNLARAKEDTVQAFIIESITRDYAAKNNGDGTLTVAPAEIDEEVAKIRSRYPDEFAFRRSLSDENITIEKFRSDLQFTLLQKKIFAKITAEIPEFKESELKEIYEAKKSEFLQPARVRLRQIVLEKEDDAKRILEELTEGKDFAKLAKQFSMAPEGANGGDTGWIEKGTLEVFDLAFKMNNGQRSKILKSPYGYHIYEVIKKEPEARLSFADAKARIRARLMEAKSQQVFTKWLEENVRKSSVKRNDELIRAIKVTTK
jgi:peptidyl-prolyl cis-trans isomerase C